ncbi:MAG TPA: hypothetical protein VIV58_34155 [Kofleriaceae bacterium]
MKFGIRTPSLRKRIAARTSWKRYVRHNLGFKAPRGWGWLTNPKRAAYNRVYNRTTVSVDRLFKTGHRRRGSRHDGSALLLVLGVFVVAAVGVYLLAAAALVFIAWLIHVATKKASAPLPDPQTTIAPAPAEAEYQVVAPVDPSVFGDPEQVRGSAGVVFDAWLAHLPKAPRHGADLVRGIEVRRRLLGRMTTKLEGRRFAWRATPITGRQTIGSPPLDPSRLDPWNPPPDLKTSSRYVATCWTCRGEGRVECAACTGAGRTQCTSCSGAGKYYGTAANGAQRLLNCKTCKGKGDVVCAACTRGAVECPTCAKAKKLECWLEIEESSREDVQIEPDGEVTKAFSWGHDGVIVPPEQIAMDAWIIGTTERARPLASSELPAAVSAEWKTDYWTEVQAKVQPGERVKSQTFTLLGVPSTEVTYAVLGHHQAVAFEGLRMLAPPPWSDALFARRASILGRVKWALAALPLAAMVIYGARGSYFVGDRAGNLVVGVVIAAAITAVCAYGVLWSSTLGRKAAVKWALAAIAPITAATVLAVLAEPTTARARAYVDAGQLASAKDELNALGSASDPRLAPVWGSIYLREALAAQTCPDASEHADKIANGLPQRVQAIDYADILAIVGARQSLESGDLDAAARALDCASAKRRGTPESRALRAGIAVAAAKRCLASKDWNCAFTRSKEATTFGATSDADGIKSQTLVAIQADVDTGISAARSEKDLGRRVQLETTTLALWTSYLAAPGTKKPAQIAALEAALPRDDQALARQVAAERQRAEAREKSRLADEQREKAREEAAARAEELRNRPVELYCSDGTISGCGCARSSFQGCCSHHGGIDGCHK